MSKLTGTQMPAQAGIEDFNGISQAQLRGIVRDVLPAMFEQEVADLCGPLPTRLQAQTHGTGRMHRLR